MSQVSKAALLSALDQISSVRGVVNSQLDTISGTVQAAIDQITTDDVAANTGGTVVTQPSGVVAVLTNEQIEEAANAAADAVRSDLRQFQPVAEPLPNTAGTGTVVIQPGATGVTVAGGIDPATGNAGAAIGSAGVADVIQNDPTANVG